MSHTKSDAAGQAIESSGIADLLRPSPRPDLLVPLGRIPVELAKSVTVE